MRINIIILFIASYFLSPVVFAGGVGLGATRIVYSSAITQSSLDIRNTSQTASFLIQSWIEDEHGNRSNDLLITPPLYVLKPATESVVKIMFSGKSLPPDRETLYWLTAKAIPQQSKSNTANTLKFASANRIKIFYRPEGLAEKSTDAFKKISASFKSGKVILTNPTPYYLTLINIKIDNQPAKSIMLPPFADRELVERFSHASLFSYQTINDYGAWTVPVRTTLKNA